MSADGAFSGRGTGGTPLSNIRAGNHVIKVKILSYNNYPISGNTYIVCVILWFSDGTRLGHGSETFRQDLNSAGYYEDLFEVPEKEYIDLAVVSHDYGTYGIRFRTKHRVTKKERRFPASGWYGAGFRDYQTVFEAREGEELCGMESRSGGLMDYIKFHFGKPIEIVSTTFELTVLAFVQKGAGFKQCKKIKYKRGVKSQSQMSDNQINEFSNTAKAKVGFEGGMFSSSIEGSLSRRELAQMYHSTLNSTNTYEEVVTEQYLDGDKGCCVCQAVVVMHLSNGESITKYAVSDFVKTDLPKGVNFNFKFKK
jgi:hypothetical protein